VDAMHNLFLGLIKEHFHNIIGIGRAKTMEGAVVFANQQATLRMLLDKWYAMMVRCSNMSVAEEDDNIAIKSAPQ